MAQDTAELVVASHGDIYTAPVGTALPTDADGALAAAFINAGLVTEDGVQVSVGRDIEDFRAWQKRQPVRREITGFDIQLSFELEQWNAENVKFAYGGGTVSEPTTGHFRYDLPDDDDALEERAIVVDWQDGAKHYRWAFSRGNVTDEVETTFQRGELSVLPITFSVLAPSAGGPAGSLMANDVAFHS